MIEIELNKDLVYYIAPYNKPALSLFESLKKQGYKIQGFVDNNKVGEDIIHTQNLLSDDNVIFAPSKYRIDIALSLSLKINCWFYKPTSNLFTPFDYYKSIINFNEYKVLFLPFNKSNVIDASLVLRQLIHESISGALIDINDHYYEKNSKLGLNENSDLPIIDLELLPYITFSALVCSIDWERTIARPLIGTCQSQGIITIGMVDGIEDFDDADYKFSRNAYNTVEYVFATGKNDVAHLQHKLDKVTVIGLPKIYDLWHTEILFPEKDQIMINVNFTYGTFEEARDEWLTMVLNVCNELNIPYIISHHHADKGDLKHLHVSNKDAYTTINNSTLIISRFSTIILESLALGKPVVYFNPHNEKVKLYKNPLGAYSIAQNTDQLRSAILYELSQRSTVRTRAKEFLHNQCNILENEKPTILASNAIKKILKENS